MHTRTFKIAVIATAALALNGVSAQTSPIGDPAEFDPSTILRPSTAPVVEVLAFDMGRIIGTQTTLIRYQATEYQRKVAEARARAYVSAQRKAVAQPQSSEKTAGTSKKKSKPAEASIAAQPAEKLPRYIAVETIKDKRTAPNVKKVVMIWDTHADSFVNNDLYDVQSVPSKGTTAKFDTYSAEYIGAGL